MGCLRIPGGRVIGLYKIFVWVEAFVQKNNAAIGKYLHCLGTPLPPLIACTIAQYIGLYTILSLPILYSKCCNKVWSGRNSILRNSVGDEGGKWGAQTRGVFASNSIDSWTKGSNKTNIW